MNIKIKEEKNKLQSIINYFMIAYAILFGVEPAIRTLFLERGSVYRE